MSVTLTRLQERGLLAVGDVLIPGDDHLPAFSQSGCAAHAGRMLEHMYDDDRQSVLSVLAVCALLPRWLIRALLSMTEKHTTAPEPIASAFRLANLGIKGVVMTLYYSDVGDGGVFDKIGWDPVVRAPASDGG